MKNIHNNLLQSSNRHWLPGRVAIIGAARSGLAAARFLIDRGINVFISDTCSEDALCFILASNGMMDISHESGEHTNKIFKNELIILSPGIPSDISILKQARTKGIVIWSEIELAWRWSIAPFIAVTGSVGKSTTVSLLGAILSVAKKDNVVAGNIGLPLISVSPTISDDGFIVAEISSFQLETIDQFTPKVAAILNLMKNHLDRYKSELEYYEAKKSIVKSMNGKGTVIVNGNDKLLMSWFETVDKKYAIVYGVKSLEYDCVWCENNVIYCMISGKIEKIMRSEDMKIRGAHNVENGCAASAMALAVGIDKGMIANGLAEFRGLPHRLEYIRSHNSIKYYNDSKATTAESVVSAIEAFGKNVHLIAGGKDKGCDYSVVKKAIHDRVKSICLIGEASGKMMNEWEGLTVINRAKTLDDALDITISNAENDDVIILSPGCSSFDMFRDFEERGDIFRELVNNI